jgi:PAS domain S-box-containing protein
MRGAARTADAALRELASRRRDVTGNHAEGRLTMNGFEAVGDPIGKALIGLDGTYLRASPAMLRITGFSVAQLVGMTVGECTYNDDRGEDRLAMDQLLAGEGESYSLEKRHRTASGGFVWM